MSDRQDKVPEARKGSNGARTFLSATPVRIVRRIGAFLLAAFLIGVILNHAAAFLDRRPHPAGFARGVLQGALMPAAFPNLLVGRDVAIYSQNNTGVSYKLGYTTGVNACGALFFGGVFWRFSRLKKSSP